jgi:hypothetical protein
MTDEVVTRLHQALVDELRKREHPADRPLKVAQIYQDLVPYRAVRPLLHVELNADYEHALLRLLAGERGLLRLEPEEARHELEREVAEAYPFVGLFRQFSASDVWVSLPADHGPDSDPEAAPFVAQPEAPEATEPADPIATVRPDAESARPEPAVARPEPAVATSSDPIQLHLPPPVPPPDRELSHGLSTCGFCDAALPAGRRVRFCPFCGADQRLHPCQRCDAVLESGWHYCISCGHEQPPT